MSYNHYLLPQPSDYYDEPSLYQFPQTPDAAGESTSRPKVFDRLMSSLRLFQLKRARKSNARRGSNMRYNPIMTQNVPWHQPALSDTSTPSSYQEQSQTSTDSLVNYPNPLAQCHICKLPHELLKIIFVQCMDPPGIFSAPRCPHSVLELMRVCSVWSYIARDHSILWSSLLIPDNINIKLLELWLSRSRCQPLSFRLDPFPGWTNVEAGKLLFANRDRWFDVSVDLDADFGRKWLRTVAGSPPDSLQGIQLHSTSNQDMDNLALVLSSCPKLYMLSVISSRLPKRIPDRSWSELRGIYLDCYVSLDMLFRLFGHCPRVEIADLSNVGWAEGPCVSVNLPHLSSLTVATVGVDPGALLDNLTLPALLHLVLHTQGGFLDHSAMDNFGDRSLCKLEKFVLTSLNLAKAEVIGYVRLLCMQSLRELSLSSGISDTLIQILTWRLDPNDLCYRGILPDLEVLRLLKCRSTADGSISSMIASRWNVNQTAAPGGLRIPHQLTSVHLVFHLPRRHYRIPPGGHYVAESESDTDLPSYHRLNDSNPYEVDFTHLKKLEDHDLPIQLEISLY